MVDVTPSVWAAEAHRLMERGDFETSLRYMNLCLDSADNYSSSPSKRLNKAQDGSDGSRNMLSVSDLFSLLEKRCLMYIRMRNYEGAINDSQRLIQLRKDYPLAYKCLLIALCKSHQLGKVRDALKLWELASPKNMEMIECRTKVYGLLEAVHRGIEPQLAFSDVEDVLNVNFDWLLKKKSDNRWKYRALPSGCSTFVLCLQHRFGHCSLGQKCPDAHGEQELQEWKARYVAENEENQDPASTQDTSVIQALLEKISNAGDECLVISEDCDPQGTKIRSREPMKVVVNSKKLKHYNWKFAVESKIPLLSACLLHEFHRQYFKIGSAYVHENGAKISLLSAGSENAQSFEVKPMDFDKGNGNFVYSVTVTFTPELLGSFRQSIVFDFGSEPKSARNLSVDVYPVSEDEAEEDLDGEGNAQGEEDPGFVAKRRSTWNFGNAEIVHSTNGQRVSSEKVGFALINGLTKPMTPVSKKESLCKENYKERMRYFLTEEERARQEIISKYNVSTLLKVSAMYSLTSGYFEGESKYAVDGCLYGQMTLFRDISEDTSVGRLILRSCNCVLLTTTDKAQQQGEKPRVYLCDISDKTKNDVYIHLGTVCVKELGLKPNDVMPFDIQFQLDRTAFMEQKKVIDKLNDTHLDILFPDFNKAYNIPWSPIMQWDPSDKLINRLNPKQKESLIAVTCKDSYAPPILLVGPFGTGKTYTLAQCIRRILTQSSGRVMICTQSNSAADLYIKEYLDKWVEEGFEDARPLRVYYAFRNFKTVHQNVLKYCRTEYGRFRNPTKEDILSHRVIVVTLGTSYLLMDLELPEDTFSHIFLDEAAQAMESEAITPLLSAGKMTKLVLAGDHMQLNPELFCSHAKNFHSSLLERLHCTYPPSHPCKLMLCENYRSHEAIIKFASASFYDNRLECGMSQPAHERIYPLSFFAARGEDLQENDSTSYFNMAEVFEVTEKVAEVISSWPESWGDVRSESSIGVLTPYADQVSKIRAHLRKRGMTHVSVERVLNVQGKQFRVVFLSTVRTHKPWVRILPEAVGSEVDLGFFSNPKLLNTALTRAQSLVAVVGDPVSLCSVGKCRVLWEDFIRTCDENRSLHGISYMQLKENMLGVEMRLLWGLNPLASEFKPKSQSSALKSQFSRDVAAAALKPSAPPPVVSTVAVTMINQDLHRAAGYQSQAIVSSSATPRIPALMSLSQPPLLSLPQPPAWGGPQVMYPYVPPNQTPPFRQIPPLGAVAAASLPMVRQRVPLYVGNFPGGMPHPAGGGMQGGMGNMNMHQQPPPPPTVGGPFMPTFAPVHSITPPMYPSGRPQIPPPHVVMGPGISHPAPIYGPPPPFPPNEPPPVQLRMHAQEPSLQHPGMQQQQFGPSGPFYQTGPQEIPRNQQRPVNPEHVSGAPLYKRPFELQGSNPPSPVFRGDQRSLASSNPGGDSLSDDDIVCLKEILRRYTDDVAEPVSESDRLKKLCTKFGVPVSESGNFVNELFGLNSNMNMRSGSMGIEMNHPMNQSLTGSSSMQQQYPFACRTNDQSNPMMPNSRSGMEPSSSPLHHSNGYPLTRPSRSPYYNNGPDPMSNMLGGGTLNPSSHANNLQSQQSTSPGSNAFASSSNPYNMRSNNGYNPGLADINGLQGPFSHLHLGGAADGDLSNDKAANFGSPRSYANVVKQATPANQLKPAENPDVLAAQQFLSLCMQNSQQSNNSNVSKPYGSGNSSAHDYFFK